MIVAGVMSGTSADGIDVALVRIAPGAAVEVLGHRAFPYPADVRAAVLAAMNADSTSVAALARLHWQLGSLYADSVERACRELDLVPSLVGLHGQTVFHQAAAADAWHATWQMGEPALVRERLGIPVVSDFRPADLAAGGQGAPLVPMLDYHLFRSQTIGRILLNLGGIANVTILPAGCSLAEVVAFDTGPANMVMDALAAEAFGRPYDAGGTEAARGRLLAPVLDRLLQDPYFAAPPPKSCGREQFGESYARGFARLCDGASGADQLATAAELTARTVADAVAPYGAGELIAAGGGVQNAHLMRRLAALLPGVRIRTVDEFGLASQAKEAVAFALLAWLTWFGLPGNVPSATGARGPRVLGKILC